MSGGGRRSGSAGASPGGGSGGYLQAGTAPLPLFAGLASAAGLLALGAPIGSVVTVGAIAWGLVAGPGLGRAATADQERRAAEEAAAEQRRRALGPRLDHWQALRRTADDSAQRFERAAARCRPGPLRDRIEEMRPEVDRARSRVHDLAELGLDLEEAVAARRDAGRSGGTASQGGGSRRRGRGRGRDRDAAPAAGPAGRGSRQALEAQRDEVERRAQEIDLSLGAAVAVAFELALESVHGGDGDMADLVGELGALRDALAELRSRPDPGP